MMRNIIFGLMALFLLAGCTNQVGMANTDENLTIFGRLSKLVELGSTEETIAYKLPVGEFFITINAEVLHAQPASLNFTIIEKESGIVRDDLTVTLQLCNAVDPKLWGAKCDNDDTPLYIYDITTDAADGLYTSETFAWERAGDWDTIMTIEEKGSAEPTITTFWTEVYGKRPPSSNAFELTNISLPFIVIGLFLLMARVRKWELIRSIDQAN